MSLWLLDAVEDAFVVSVCNETVGGRWIGWDLLIDWILEEGEREN
jgi:hypothetical protein